MKALILAAGYATRLYPLTENFPKPLLKVQQVSIIDRLLSSLEEISFIDEYIVVSNHKFFQHFVNWKNEAEQKKLYEKTITLLDDGSIDNEHRLGAVQDIEFAIEKCSINDDLFVLAGDNVLDFSLKPFAEYQQLKKTAVIMCHEEKNVEKLKKTGVVEIDDQNKVISMEEKPENPKSFWAVPPFYIYPKEELSWIKKGICEGCGTDAPGSFIAWYCNSRCVYAWPMPGKRYDVGDSKSYEAVQSAVLNSKK